MIGQSSWIVDSIQPTQYQSVEFMVRLRRIARGQDTQSEQPDELLATAMVPDWLAEQKDARLRTAAVQTELDAARRRARRLKRRLSQRDVALTEVREKLVGQRKEIRRLRRRVERAETAAEQGHRSWRRRVSAAATRVLPRRGGKPAGP